MAHLRSAAAAQFVIVLLMLLVTPASASAQYTVHTLLDNGPSEERVTIFLLAEGYTQAELPRFMVDARKVMDDIFAVSPFTEYKDFFNVLAIEVASNESGADHPDQGIYRDTYFQVTYGSQPLKRVMAINFPEGSDRLWAIREELGLYPWNAIHMLLVNDEEQGGVPGITARGYNEYAAVVHEIGHQFGFLEDDYIDYDLSSTPEGRNLTSETRREHVKWRHWFEDDTPIPTLFHDDNVALVGLFEGGGYTAEGVYRPQMFCRMSDHGEPFCAVCREHIVGNLHSFSNTRRMRMTSPAEDTLLVPAGETARFELRAPLPAHGLSMQWRVNGVDVAEGLTSFSVDATSLGWGEHTVELVVADETPMVRDPELLPLLTTSRRWMISVPAAQATEGVGLDADVVVLAQNFPNPVRAATVFTFHLPRADQVRLSIFDVLGREVTTIRDGLHSPGQHQIEWSAAGTAPGLYLYRLQVGPQVLVRRMLVN